MQLRYSQLTEKEKNFVDLIEGIDNGKRIRNISVDVSYNPKNPESGAKAQPEIITFALSEGDIKRLKASYSGGLKTLLRTADELVAKKLRNADIESAFDIDPAWYEGDGILQGVVE